MVSAARTRICPASSCCAPSSHHRRPAAVEQRLPARHQSGHLHLRQGRARRRSGREGFDPKKLVTYVTTRSSSYRTEARNGPARRSWKDARAIRDPQVEAVISVDGDRLSHADRGARSLRCPQGEQATLEIYGRAHARGCLLAVRFVEKGVRMVQVYYANGDPWDATATSRPHQDRDRLGSAVRGGDQGSQITRALRRHSWSAAPSSGARRS